MACRAQLRPAPANGTLPRGASRWIIPLGLLAWCAVQSLSAAWETSPAPEPPPAVRTEQLRAWNDFNRSGRWQIRWNPSTGTPTRISGHRLDLGTPVRRETVEEVARSLLSELRSLLGIDPDALSPAEADYESPRPGREAAGTWYLRYRQVYRGVPVEGGAVHLTVRGRQVTSLGADFYPGVELSVGPKVSAAEAIRKVRKLAPRYRALKPLSVRLRVYPRLAAGFRRYSLAWEVTLPAEKTSAAETVGEAAGNPLPGAEQGAVQWRYRVDAATGDILDRFDGLPCGDLPRSLGCTLREPVSRTLEVPGRTNGAVAGALADLGTLLGAAYADGLARRALKQGPASAPDLLSALLQEDDDPAYSSAPASADNDLADGTPNIDRICHAFVDLHGIYDPACAGHTRQPVAVIRSPDPAGFNVVGTASAYLGVEGTALGTAADPLASFTLEYAPADSPDTWLDAGVRRQGDGAVAVANGRLGWIDLGGLSDGVYVVRLTVSTRGGARSSASARILVNGKLLSGWPQALGTHFDSSPAVAPVDPAHPGQDVVAVGGSELFVWHSDGSPAPGWPQSVGWTVASPAVGDLEGNGSLEILVHNLGGRVYAFRHDGALAPGWPRETGGAGERSTPVLADLDGDGTLEVVVGSRDGHVYAWHSDGSAVKGWPVSVSGEVDGSPAIADIGGDGALEVVAASDEGKVYAWHADGTPVSGWPQTVPGPAQLGASPVLGDLDGDGHLEILVATVDRGSPHHHLYAWHHDASPVDGWPQAFDAPTLAPAPVVLADLDGDGNLEVLAMAADGVIHAWHGDGRAVSGWPPNGSGDEVDVGSAPSLAVADIDGDGDVEVVAGAYPSRDRAVPGQVSAFHANGAEVIGWPKTLPARSGGAPAIADIDQDGEAEVVVSSDGVFVWRLGGTFGSLSGEWPLYRHDNRRTGAYGPKTAVALLFDSSGSMSWAPDGSFPTPSPKQRLTLVKNAARPFLELLDEFGAGKANFGVATFPAHPSDKASPCAAQVLSAMTLVTPASARAAWLSALQRLEAAGSTPLLSGIEKAARMFGTESNRAIVLLTDGDQNCPNLGAGEDTQTQALIGLLKNSAARVFPIEVGLPTDAHRPLLAALAQATAAAGYAGSRLHDVTVRELDALARSSMSGLPSALTTVLADILGLDVAAESTETIGAGETRSYRIDIDPRDRRFAFVLSWRKPQRGRLGLALKSADGAAMTPESRGIGVREGDTYLIVTADRRFLSEPGKIGREPWAIEIRGLGLEKGESEPLYFGALVDSPLRLRGSFDRSSYGTGQTITLRARVTDAGQPLTGLEDVQVTVDAPEDGLGNWLSRNSVSPAELQRIPEYRGSEALSALVRKGIYLADVSRVPLPAHRAPETLRLFDDGTHGDATANDGIYTGRFADTGTEGTYAFHVRAAGLLAASGSRFERERRLERRVAPEISAPRTTVSSRPAPGSAGRRIELVIAPRDSLGNHLGPGYAGVIRVAAKGTELVGDLADRLDGSYAQLVRAPSHGTASVSFDVLGVPIQSTVGSPGALSAPRWVWTAAPAALLVAAALGLLLRRRRKPRS